MRIYGNGGFGKKAEMLYLLKKTFPHLADFIPKSYIIDSSVFDQIMAKNNKDEIKTCEDIQIDDELLNKVYGEVISYFKDAPLVFRSSAFIEDTVLFSASGQYKTCVNIKNKNEAKLALQKIYFSMLNRNAKIYEDSFNLASGINKMSILVQELMIVDMAGVLFSVNPINGEHETIIEYEKGNGVNIVAGSAPAVERIVIKNDNISKSLPDFKKLYEISKEIKDFLGYEIDFEWGIKDGKIYIFQVRPCKISLKKTEFTDYECDEIIPCEVFSRGYAIGKINSRDKLEDYNIIGDIRKFEADNIELIQKSSGLIVNVGGYLSHIANICREFEKVFVRCEKEFKQGEIVFIDGFKGQIMPLKSIKKNFAKVFWDTFLYQARQINSLSIKSNGIISANYEHVWEIVFFDFDEEKLISKLKEKGFCCKEQVKKYQTYDYENKDLIKENMEFRISQTNEETVIQLKSFNTSETTNFRFDRSMKLYFQNEKYAKKYMKNLGVIQTGTFERHEKLFQSPTNDVLVKFLKWSGKNVYIGIESNNISNIQHFMSEFGLSVDNSDNIGGVEIFKKLNINFVE